MVVFVDGLVVVPDGQVGGLQNVDDEHGMVGGEGTTALGDDVRVREVILLADVDELRHGVVGILLYGVVHGVLPHAGACAVVVYAKAVADVHEVETEAHLRQLYVELRGLAQGILDAAYLGNLAADVEVDELEAVHQVVLSEEVEGLEELGGVEPELADVAAALLPLAAACRRELDADAEVGADVELAGDSGYELELVELFYYKEDLAAHLLGQQGQLHVFLVLVAVADDHGTGVGIHGQDGV